MKNFTTLKILNYEIMKFIDRNLNIYSKNPIKNPPDLKGSSIISDTEFTKYIKLIVDIIGVYLPELIPEYLVSFDYSDLNENFHPLVSTLKAFDYKVDIADEEYLISVIENIQNICNDKIDFSESSKIVKFQFKELIEYGCFDKYLQQLNIESENIKLKRNKTTKDYEVILAPKKLIFPFRCFYAFADFFKIWGKKYQEKILETNLVQQRCLKLQSSYGRELPLVEYCYINGILHEFCYPLREIMYRFPPINKSLDAQTNIFEVTTQKLNVNTWLVAKALGFDSLDEIKRNFTKFKEKMPELALKYNAVDIFASSDLDIKQQEFYDVILKTFDIEPIEVNDTTGSNVNKFLLQTVYKEFGAFEKAEQREINKIIKLGNLNNLENTPLNDFGCQPFLTVGGLLYSRMALIKYIEGKLSDCDLKSCYASFMSLMNIYLGEPIVLTCKYDKYKISLGEAIELIENQKAPHDGYFIRVTGKFNKVINTLVMSDLKFQKKNIKQQQFYEVSDNRKSVESFNAYKTSKRSAQSTILTKEVKFGFINHSIIEALKKLPPDWYQEYLDLKCDVVCYFPGDLIADNIVDYQKIKDSLPKESCIEKFDIKKGFKEVQNHRYQNNAVLAFPINKYWKELKTKRGEFKKEKNPIQEVFKLFGNSGYGVLACLYLAMNNLVASNMITAAARSGAWLMTNAINGMGSITDGTAFSWENLPVNKTFHKVLKNNPKYLENFDDSVVSNIEITKDFNYQKWIDNNLKKHMASFYQVNASTDYNLNHFDYELKTEKFLTDKGTDFLNNNVEEVEELKHSLGVNFNKYMQKNEYIVETPLFTKFYNNNAGNYCKGIDKGDYLIDGTEYEIANCEPSLKARSFQGKDNTLIDWYCTSIRDKYTEPLIYSETKLIKFGDGNQLAISFLESGSDEIAHPMGFDTTAYKVMKLVTRSQFLFQNELQLRNFETNEETLANLSKFLGLNHKVFWQEIKEEDIKQYGVELRKNVDYFNYAKTHSVGIGFELLALAPSIKGDIGKVRKKIVNLIDDGCTNFGKYLNLQRNLKLGNQLKNILAAIIVLKKNAEVDLRQLLENSAKEPTILNISKENIRRLHELKNKSSED